MLARKVVRGLALSSLMLLGACVCNRTVATTAEVPPAPPPAPAALSQTVYFAWDKSDLTPEAHAVITQVASENKTPLEVVGHTDTSGSDSYNQSLGQRRADTVADALRAQNATVCAAASRGESDLAVSTGDGVREPLNRRATITRCP